MTGTVRRNTLTGTMTETWTVQDQARTPITVYYQFTFDRVGR